MGKFGAKVKEEIKKDRAVFIIYIILRVIVLAVAVLEFLLKDYQGVFYCVLTLILLMLPSLFERKFKVELPTGLEITVLVFIFAAEILGELACYYLTVPHWDTMLHTINGFICAAIGFSLVDILNRDNKIKFSLSPFFMAFVAFCFSMTVGVLWEFYEFASDSFLGTDMQKDTVINIIRSVDLNTTGKNIPVVIDNIKNVTVNGVDLGLGGYLDIGLHDTMKDLIVNFIGAVIFAFIGFFYVKKRGKGKFARQFIPYLMDEALDENRPKKNALSCGDIDADIDGDAHPSDLAGKEEGDSASSGAKKDES